MQTEPEKPTIQIKKKKKREPVSLITGKWMKLDYP